MLIDEQTCETCRWWQKDWGIFTATGWTGSNREDGECHYEVVPRYKRATDCCHHWTAKTAKQAGS